MGNQSPPHLGDIRPMVIWGNHVIWCLPATVVSGFGNRWCHGITPLAFNTNQYILLSFRIGKHNLIVFPPLVFLSCATPWKSSQPNKDPTTGRQDFWSEAKFGRLGILSGGSRSKKTRLDITSKPPSPFSRSGLEHEENRLVGGVFSAWVVFFKWIDLKLFHLKGQRYEWLGGGVFGEQIWAILVGSTAILQPFSLWWVTLWWFLLIQTRCLAIFSMDSSGSCKGW